MIQKILNNILWVNASLFLMHFILKKKIKL